MGYVQMTPDDPRHGTTPGFHQGCRCAPCRASIAAYEKRGRWHRHNNIPRAVPAIGSQRRIQALMALGWTSEDIALAGRWHHRNAVLRILNGQKGKPCNWVERSTHQRVHDVFEKLCMTIPEMNGYRKRCRTIALNKGYVVPLAWDDIDNDTAPNLGEHTRRDLLADFDELVGLGESEHQAARRLGVTPSAIEQAQLRARKAA